MRKVWFRRAFRPGSSSNANLHAVEHSSAPSTSDSVADAHKAEELGASVCKQDEAFVEIFLSGWFGILRGEKP
jgi:hypothetical protein